jgi:hypothetical protein
VLLRSFDKVFGIDHCLIRLPKDEQHFLVATLASTWVGSREVMNLAIMQPYFFPYQGYFQLMAAADRFVVYDDVAFIKNGWINRNRILSSSGVEYVTVPLVGAGSSRSIEATRCAPPRLWRDKILRKLEQAYARASEREVGIELVRRVLQVAGRESIRDLAVASICEVRAFAGISTDILESSSGYGNRAYSGSARVLDICRREAATTYINLPGGRSLYDSSQFESNGVNLRFLCPSLDAYPQSRGDRFVAGLSILDLIMNVSRDEVNRRLRRGTVEP